MKMPPRLSARRLLLLITIFGAVTLIITIHSGLSWPQLANSNRLDSNDPDGIKTTPAAGAKDNNPLNSNNDNDNSNFKVVINDGDDVKPTKEVVKPWYMQGGKEYPENYKGPLRLFPDQADGDRITEQLMYVPENYQDYDSPVKEILLYNGLGTWGQTAGSRSFHNCPVSRCLLTDDREKAATVDAILYKDHFIHPGVQRPKKQIWIIYFLECPYHTQNVKFSDAINWTATYRRDSDLVAPYERWTYYDPQVRQKVQNVDYAANKTKKVAWFVSNCGARNGRLAYARELGKYIQVDIYGNCGTLSCPRSNSKCFEILDKEYKFYLAFENSNCRDYITEKFYVNGLGHNVLPIVMGARPEDYQRSAPEGSYIHVDEFAGPEELAAYLHRLDHDNDLYNSYFKWKGTGEFINTYFWCRLCAMLHAPITPRHYEDVNDWWRGAGICTNKSWRNAEFV